MTTTRSTFWQTPKSRDFSGLSDPLLFSEVLTVAQKDGLISLHKLISESEGLRRRLRRLWVVEKPTRTTISGLLSAMKHFGWLRETRAGQFELTPEGSSVYWLSTNHKAFRRALAVKMQERYVIPGWLVSRLFELNPKGQGEIVLPSPPRDWQLDPVPWESSGWSRELSEQATASADRARRIFPGSFPVGNDAWVEAVRINWERLGSVTRRRVSMTKRGDAPKGEKPGIAKFTPRGRLAQAMRDAAVELLFASASLGSDVTDFASDRHPIPPRAFRAWCPRLDALEFVFYTDSHPMIFGRLMFPCCAFRDKAPVPPFEPLYPIRDPRGRKLFLYQPTWECASEQFIGALVDAYSLISRKVGALYISLLDLRDEVCRQLRLSSALFDTLLEEAYRRAIALSLPTPAISISIESDVRHEQQSGHGLLRRPVYIEEIPHSLIAISRRHR